ncbi:hypothetical protein [Enterococcus sp. BWR-S5]|uniref:hypothetical protein n=1 Tax=Enterococcus sp. BWR-S5 TaxID=2787714 RepID=UPI0019204FB1|nr:hypothetical protein [Enterococcus sp. BWR-S5]MBL1227231.1 hypothetical protein [Enterococcus sp. BWR-S5]
MKNRTRIFRTLDLTEDPSFYQYESAGELSTMNSIELTKRLYLLRKENRRLSEKIYRTKNRSSDQIDKDNLKKTETYLEQIENLLIEKQGYFPYRVDQSMIAKEIKKHEACRKKYS